MAAQGSGSGFSPGKRRWSIGHLVPLALCLAVLVVLPGCGGCRKTPEQIQAEREKKEAEQRAKEREKKKPDLEPAELVSLPHEENAKLCYYKSGHWTATAFATKANNFDVVGDLEMSVVDGEGKQMRLPGMPYTSTGSRQITLPKGQAKVLQSVIYVPPAGGKAGVSSRVNARQSGRGVYEQRLPLTRMPAHQYHFVVLARWPQSYKYVDGLDSVKHPSDLVMEESELAVYRVHLLRTDKRTTLPSHALFWTSIAYILWDDAEPTAILPDQQQAFLDWLHWGGQLIVSGPDSLDALRRSFLGPYLPATSTATRELTAADLEQMSTRWTLPVHGRPERRLAPVVPWSGVQFDVHPEARAVPGTGGLLVERHVGQGRIVVSAFALDNPDLTSWPGFDGFFNACLLGRPPRQFIESDLAVRVVWADGGLRPLDPRAIAKLRYFTRDTGTQAPDPGRRNPYRVPSRNLLLTEEEASQIEYPDVGSWSDFNAVANSAREALQSAAQIEIPERMFVIWVVGVYLLVLVPANWAVFRSIGRVEWAWAAAPVIAVVYTVIVIRLAQLDIGFARSMTEIAVVEMQGEHGRAHVTRYTALYTSLATTYECRLEDAGAQVLPFPAVQSPDEFFPVLGQGVTELEHRYGTDVRMRGFHVTSNSTGMIHSEQMADMGGPILLTYPPGGGYRIANQTAFTLQGAGVVRKNEWGELETAWIGTLKPERMADLDFSQRPETDVAGRLWPNQRSRSPLTAAEAPHGELNFRQLVALAEAPGTLQPGDVTLVGWFEENIPGLEIRPSAPQSRHAALVVAHLRYGFGGDPQPDKNTRRAVEQEPRRVFEPGLSALPEDQIP